MTSRALLFDLDDTLFLEEDFVASGLGAVADHCACACGAPAGELFDHLWYDFRRLGRTQIFDRFLKAYPMAARDVAELVGVYRDHEPRLDLPALSRLTLKRARDVGRVGLVTDGAPRTQRHKVAALGLEAQVDLIVYAWDHAPKPDPAGFLHAARSFGLAPQDCVIVGDDPFHDVAAARAAGMACVRVRTGRAREIATRLKSPRYVEISGLEELDDALRSLDV